MKCAWPCCNNNTENNRSDAKFCSIKCKRKHHVDKRRKRLKQKAVEYKGGKCSQCGYNKCISALEFHHVDPASKEFGISSGETRAWSKLIQELDKCVLLCANCHRELEAVKSTQ